MTELKSKGHNGIASSIINSFKNTFTPIHSLTVLAPKLWLGLECIRILTQEVTPLFSWAVGPRAFASSLHLGLLCLWAWAEADIRSTALGTHRAKVTTPPKQAGAHPRPFWEYERGKRGEREVFYEIYPHFHHNCFGNYFNGLWEKGQPLML